MENDSMGQAYVDLITAQYKAKLTGEPLIRLLFKDRKPTPEEFIEFIAQIICNDHSDVG